MGFDLCVETVFPGIDVGAVKMMGRRIDSASG